MEGEYMPLLDAAKYLGISRVKLAHLVREGVLPYTTSPFDKRVKLFRREDLDNLSRAPRAPRRQKPTERQQQG